MKRRPLSAVLVCSAVLGLVSSVAGPVDAAPIVSSATDSGWYNDSGNHGSSNPNYIAGWRGNIEYNNFFVFDLSSVTGTIVGAELRLENPTSGYESPDATETYSLFDVSTSIASLTAGGSGLTGTFADLGSGTSYGSLVMSVSDNGTVVTISLNSAGIAALNAAAGGSIAIGGAVTTLTMTTNVIENVFAFSSNGTETKELVLTTIPEPSSLALFGVGALGLGGARWRRRMRAA